VVLEDGFGAERLAEHGGVLLDDAGVGDDVDHPFEAMSERMLKGKGERRQSFAAAGRHREGEEARLLLRLLPAGGEDGGTLTVHQRVGGLCNEVGEIRVELSLQIDQGGRSGPPHRPALDPIVEGFGVQVICVDQTGEHHPCEERCLEAGAVAAPSGAGVPCQAWGREIRR
jgi:hypothetical protein